MTCKRVSPLDDEVKLTNEECALDLCQLLYKDSDRSRLTTRYSDTSPINLAKALNVNDLCFIRHSFVILKSTKSQSLI